MGKTRKARMWLGTATVLGVSVGLFGSLLTGVAHADYQPSAKDVVGVGGDTQQYEVGFVASGDTDGDAGYNSAGNANRLVSIDATADANGRTAYAQGSSESSPVALNPTVVLRAGTSPVERPTSSGLGITAILNDTGAVPQINFTRSSSLPSTTNQSAAAKAGWGYLHVVQIGSDPLVVVADNTTNAPAGLSINDLLGIYKGTYKTWNAIPGNSSGSSDTIIPLIPPSGSSVNKTFIADLDTANSNSTFTLASSVLTVEQNDPTAVTGAADPADAIVPFSQARLNLWNGTSGTDNEGYFLNPAGGFEPPGTGSTACSSPPGTAFCTLAPGIKVLNGSPPEGGTATAYSDTLPLYVIFRESDASDAPWQPGSTLNWVQALFSNPAAGAPLPYFASAEGQALVAAAGGVPGYNDLGDVHS